MQEEGLAKLRLKTLNLKLKQLADPISITRKFRSKVDFQQMRQSGITKSQLASLQQDIPQPPEETPHCPIRIVQNSRSMIDLGEGRLPEINQQVSIVF